MSKILWRWSVSASGCFISPRAQIGPGVAFPHPTGIVIGEGVEIGPDVTIYQNVTLGRLRGEQPQYPKIGEKVVIYAGAIVVGDVQIGSNSVIGAGAYVNRSAPSRTVLVGSPAVAIEKPAAEH